MEHTVNLNGGLNVYDFEYAVKLDAPLVSLFRFDGKKWNFIRNITRWNGITVCQITKANSDENLLIFPVGMIPDQIWKLLNDLEKKRTGNCV